MFIGQGEVKQWVSAHGALVICAAAVVFAVARHVPTVLQPGLSGYALNHDESAMLQIAQRAHDRLGFNSSALVIKDDLSAVHYRYPTLWPPGVPLLLLGPMRLGLPRHLTYKFFHLLFVLLGAIGWMMLAKRELEKRALLLFAMLLGAVFADPWMKMADLVLWCITPFYLVCVLGVVRGEARSVWVSALLAGLLTAVAPLFWTGAIYLPVAGGLAIVVAGRRRLRERFGAAIPVVALGTIGFGLVRWWVSSQAGGGYFAGWTPGFYLLKIPLKSYLPSAVKLFGDLLGVFGISRSALRALHGLGHTGLLNGLTLAAYLVVACAMAMLAIAAFRRGLISQHARILALLAGAHFLLVFGELFYINVRYEAKFYEAGGFNYLIQADRYMRHIVPLTAMAWLALISPWWHRQPSNASEKRYRTAAGILFALSAVVLCVLILAKGAKIALNMGQSSRLTAVVGMKIADSSGPTSDRRAKQAETLIPSLIRSQELYPHVIFTHDPIPYMIEPDLVSAVPSPEDRLPTLRNTRRVFIFITKASGDKGRGIRRSMHEKNATAMISALHLPLLERCAASTAVYGGWVDPFPTGHLAAPAPSIQGDEARRTADGMRSQGPQEGSRTDSHE